MDNQETLQPNQSRQRYLRLLHRPSSDDLSEAISAKNEFESLLNHRGWKRLEKFIAMQEDGILATMKRGIKPDLIFGKNRLQKYDDMQSEMKGYAKIRKFIEMVIQNGKRSELRAAKAAQAAEKRAKK